MAACRATAAARNRTRATARHSDGVASRQLHHPMRYVRTNSYSSGRRICHALFGALIVLAVSSAGAQQTNEAARLPGLSFLEALGVPLARDFAAVELSLIHISEPTR